MTSKSESLSFKRIFLQDIQPLFGGLDIALKSDGDVRVHIVTPREKVRGNKYWFTLQATKLEEIDNLLAENEFEKIHIIDRPGKPDEASPKITVLYRSGKEVVKQKWANDEHPQFDKIYNWLVQLARDIEREGTPDIEN